jgi:hypothetical protein
MCLLDGSFEIARLKVAGAVRAMSLWHWKESIVLLGARIVAMVCWLWSVTIAVRVRGPHLDVAFRESLRDVQFSNDVSLRLRHSMRATRSDQTDTRVWKVIWIGSRSVLEYMSRYL